MTRTRAISAQRRVKAFGALLGSLLLGAAAASAMAQEGSQNVPRSESAASVACFEAARTTSQETGACDRALAADGLSAEDRAATFVNRAIILTRAARYEPALEDLRSALKLQPKLGEAFLNRGNIHFLREEFSQAINDYSLAIQFEAASLYAAYFNRGLIYERFANTESALEDFRAAVRLRPDFQAARDKVAALEGR